MLHAEDGLALLEVDPHRGPLTEHGLVGVVRRVAQEGLLAGVEPGTKKLDFNIWFRPRYQCITSFIQLIHFLAVS